MTEPMSESTSGTLVPPTPGDEVPCTHCRGRGWVLYDTGKRRPRDVERGECRTCKGTGVVTVATDVGPWTLYLYNEDNRPSLMDVNPKVQRPIEVCPTSERDRYREALRDLVDAISGPVGRMGLRDPDPEEVADWRVMYNAIKQAREVIA